MTIDEVIDIFLEGRRLKHPATGALRQMAFIHYDVTNRGGRIIKPDADIIHHDVMSHRQAGADTSSYGEFLANAQEIAHGNTKERAKAEIVQHYLHGTDHVDVTASELYPCMKCGAGSGAGSRRDNGGPAQPCTSCGASHHEKLGTPKGLHHLTPLQTAHKLANIAWRKVLKSRG